MTRFRLSVHHLAALSAVALAGCVTQPSTRYPSLLPRAIEQRSDSEPEVTTAIVAPDPATDAVLRDIRTVLDRAVASFDPAASNAERLSATARGAAVGSDRWIAAQTALAELDGYRATTSSAVTDVDTLALARAADGKPDYPAIATVQTAAQTALDAQTARIAAIAATLTPA